MPEQNLSRRTFLAATGLGATALLCAANSAIRESPFVSPSASPHNANNSSFVHGPYHVGQVILGETPGTAAMVQPFTPGQVSGGAGNPPTGVLAAVYYPSNPDPPNLRDHRVPTPNPLQLVSGPFPLLLYAHAYRGSPYDGNGSHPAARDFISVGAVLSYVASFGCICVAPDLSWLPYDDNAAAGVSLRAVLLAGYYSFLANHNATLFAQQLDLSRLILVGHSHGATSVTQTGRILLSGATPSPFQSLAYGLIAPEEGGGAGPDIRDLLVLGGALDHDQDADPGAGYRAAGTPKTLVMIPGANHFGYTDICAPDNTCASILLDENGTISRDLQQQIAAEYLGAMVRFYALHDETMRPYLRGDRIVEGLEIYGIQLQSEGFILPPPRPTLSPRTKP
jgi:hypothetical protein